jgi:hypothetical protein
MMRIGWIGCGTRAGEILPRAALQGHRSLGNARSRAGHAHLGPEPNEDHKGYHAPLSAFVRAVAGEPNDAPTIAEGAAAMRVRNR